MMRGHILYSWAVFVNLIKGFDSIHRELLFYLFKIFGVPEKLVNVLKVYNVKIKDSIEYKTGVKQGDNLAPILFIIIMQFMSKLILKNQKCENFSDYFHS